MKIKLKKKKIFEEIIKNGKYIFIFPILSVIFSPKNLIKEENNKKYPVLIGTLVKKKF
ncbi:hypothetical protein [Blattabacterium cuenoti]|uniref:hypothetical protein n=1 Tax=Blattabacterium cuenoti TaxID=1653831 RepID=UPI00163CEA31|nr:hypothetical protein [Blattabacterium cuenoti]